MVLSFEFNYISQNALLENLLAVICKDFDIFYKIGKVGSVITLKVQGSEEVLSDFSNFISERLPLSIFFKSTAVNVVESIDLEELDIQKCTLTLPFTPKILKQSNPLMNNEVGNATFDAKGIVLSKNSQTIINANEEKSFDKLYSEVAMLISAGEQVHINSASGSYLLGKINESFIKNIKDEFVVIPTDLSVVEKMLVIRENEIKAIASLEKPSIRLRLNSLYAAKEILPSTRVKMKLSDELLLVKICEKLYKSGVEFLYRVNCSEYDTAYKLEIDGKFSLIPQIEVCVLENGEMLIVSGDGYSASSVKENLKKFEDSAHAQFASIMQEHNLFGEKVSCFYLSQVNDDMLMHLSEQTGMLNLVNFPILRSFKEIFEAIEKSNTGSKLLNNYKEKFPEIFEKALHVSIPNETPNSIYSMWGITAVILGLSDNITHGANTIIEYGEDFGGQKGPRIDYILKDKEAIKSDFDMLKLVRSVMSFKLADTDDVTLSFGMMESLAYFLSDTSDSCKENLSSTKTLLGGSMFGIRKFSEIACKNIKAGNQICLNKELPIDN